MCSRDTSSATPWLFCDSRDARCSRSRGRTVWGLCSAGEDLSLFFASELQMETRSSNCGVDSTARRVRPVILSSAGFNFRLVREKCAESSHEMPDMSLFCPPGTNKLREAGKHVKVQKCPVLPRQAALGEKHKQYRTWLTLVTNLMSGGEIHHRYSSASGKIAGEIRNLCE